MIVIGQDESDCMIHSKAPRGVTNERTMGQVKKHFQTDGVNMVFDKSSIKYLNEALEKYSLYLSLFRCEKNVLWL